MFGSFENAFDLRTQIGLPLKLRELRTILHWCRDSENVEFSSASFELDRDESGIDWEQATAKSADRGRQNNA
jgi:hypothetical protein